MPLVYAELRKMARRRMQQQNPDHTLQTTALIHSRCCRRPAQLGLNVGGFGRPGRSLAISGRGERWVGMDVTACPGNAPTGSATQGKGFDVAPDGQKVLFVCSNESQDKYIVTVGWQARK